MQSVIDKMVYSLSAPTNKNVVWVKPTGNGTFEMRIYDNNTWVPLSSGGSGGSSGSGSGIDIVDSVDKLDPNAEVGSIASVATPGSIQETSFRNLYQPDASMIDQNIGTLAQPELLSSVSSLKVFAPTDFTNIGFEPVEASFYLVPRDFSMTNGSAAIIQVFDGGVVGIIMEGGPDITQEFVLVEYYPDNDSFLVNDDQVKAFNAILANGMDWCYFGSPDTGFVITEEQFNTLDLFVNAVAGMPTIADVYIKKDKWEPLFVNTESNDLSGRVDIVENELHTLSSEVDLLNDRKANNITFATYSSYNKVLPNVYTIHTISSTNSVNIILADIERVGIYNEYILELKCNSTPNSVGFKNADGTTRTIVWANGTAPTFEAGMTYLISIAKGLGVYSIFPNS